MFINEYYNYLFFKSIKNVVKGEEWVLIVKGKGKIRYK